MKGKKGKDKKRKDKFEPINLPDDAVTEILLRFPVKSLLRFRCVCKKWCEAIDSHFFKKKHLAYQLNRYHDELLVVKLGCKFSSRSFLSYYENFRDLSCMKKSSSCQLNIDSFSYHINGVVVCVSWCGDGAGLHITMCNPALREFRKIPKFPSFPVGFGITNPVQTSAVGIGFDVDTDDYIVVMFLHALEMKCVSYRVKAESWMMIEMPPSCAYRPTIKDHRYELLYASFFSHGCIHWCIGSRRFILTLNMNTKAFQEIQFPIGWDDYRYNHLPYLLNVDNSRIALSAAIDLHKLDIWVMKEYGVAESWIKQYYVSLYSVLGSSPISRPLSFWRKDKLFLLTTCGKVICYDLSRGQLYEYQPPRGQRDSMSQPPHLYTKTFEVVTCCGSLVSINQT